MQRTLRPFASGSTLEWRIRQLALEWHGISSTQDRRYCDCRVRRIGDLMWWSPAPKEPECQWGSRCGRVNQTGVFGSRIIPPEVHLADMMCPPPLAYRYEARVKLSTHADWRMSSSFQICWICSVTNANARRTQELGTHRDNPTRCQRSTIFEATSRISRSSFEP